MVDLPCREEWRDLQAAKLHIGDEVRLLQTGMNGVPDLSSKPIKLWLHKRVALAIFRVTFREEMRREPMHLK